MTTAIRFIRSIYMKVTAKQSNSSSYDRLIIDYSTAKFKPACFKTETAFIKDATHYLVSIKAIKPLREKYNYNTGPIAEYALQQIMLNNWNLSFTNTHLQTDEGKIITPDFYHTQFPYMIELKSKAYFSENSNEKIDGIVRKYYPVVTKYKKPLIVVFASGNIVSNEYSEMIRASSIKNDLFNVNKIEPIIKDFVEFSQKYGVHSWKGLDQIDNGVL